MKRLYSQSFFALIMIGAAVAAFFLTPTKRMADEKNINLENLIPSAFGGWKALPQENSSIVQAPDVEKTLSKLYTGLLMRTYVNASGERMMLAIAYGPDQRDNIGKQVHKPEICYPAQGFIIKNPKSGHIQIAQSEVPVRRMVASYGERVEPLTYWLTIGNKAVNNNKDFKLNQVRYGLAGWVADGMIVRVSTIDNNVEAAYEKQAYFLSALLLAMPADKRKYLGIVAGGA
ncbi:exosortase-associated protein EpsI, B-type [Chitinibacter tainanensis]|uniref:exosortase-associated protein EpsI, B-type n=1 Tax=Chitinibacter tainanensis TaxID=230667 RepID=UPI00048D8C28|nr:exosortase-associated protein EpsI, B-type [Chitinibacter tainanensis]